MTSQSTVSVTGSEVDYAFVLMKCDEEEGKDGVQRKNLMRSFRCQERGSCAQPALHLLRAAKLHLFINNLSTSTPTFRRGTSTTRERFREGSITVVNRQQHEPPAIPFLSLLSVNLILQTRTHNMPAFWLPNIASKLT